MAKILNQYIETDAKTLLKELSVPMERFSPGVVAQIPIMATGLLAGLDAKVEWDAYNNPFIVAENSRIALATVLVYENKIFVYNREGLDLQNLNEKLDVIGAIGFGISSGPFKWPVEMTMKKIKSVKFSDFMAVEETDGDGDYGLVKMPIVVVEVEDIKGLESHFIDIPEINEKTMTAKLQAAIKSL